MLRFLFPRLTPAQRRGQPLFDVAVAEARARHWYAEGGVPDTLDGRFAMLATVCALISVRLEAMTDGGVEQSAALTERFVEAMDAEHRQMGLNDPALGKKVRKMVASLGRRVEGWRAATAGERDWNLVTLSSVHGAASASDEEASFTAERLRGLWQRLQSSDNGALVEGKF
ncbi:MAG TPA: ubiquinol-cytochrome C chaperone family protein [Sphingomicrobium sp.]|nr:ubiquinol-cytochrome C chaperone family protein [Sphingomicrobium sp.]